MRKFKQNIKTSEDAIKNYFFLLNEESKNIKIISENNLVQKELNHLYEVAYPFPLEEISVGKREKILRGKCRGRWSYIINEIIKKNGQIDILDAGCGWGIYSQLFALLGAKTVGVDLRDERIGVAEARKNYYQKDFIFNDNLAYFLKNIFSLDFTEKFDIIWATEAISHISPAEKFLEHTYNMLKKGGLIIIVDPNGMYVPNQIELFRQRGLKLYYTRKDPETGKNIEYADERIFSLCKIASMLKKSGFNIIHRQASIGFHQKANEFIYKKIIFPLENTFLINDIFGSNYLIVGKKIE